MSDPVRTDFIDHPTAWQIQNEVGSQLEHHPDCSAVYSLAFLCDCAAMPVEWARRCIAQGEPKVHVMERLQPYLPESMRFERFSPESAGS